MILSIILRKNVIDIAQAETLTAIVKEKLADNPEISVIANISDTVGATPID